MCMSGPIPLIPSWFWDAIVMPRLRTLERIRFRVFINSESSFADTFGRILVYMCLIPETQVSTVHEFSLYENDGEGKELELGIHTNINNSKVTTKHLPNNTFRTYEQEDWLITIDAKGKRAYNIDAVLAIIRHSPLLYLLGKYVHSPHTHTE